MITILVDLDGVLVDFMAGAIRAHGREGLCVTNYDVWEQMGLTREAFWRPLESYAFWSSLPWTPDGDLLLGRLEMRHSAASISLCTTPHPHESSYAGKFAWVKRYLPYYADRLHMTARKADLARHDAVLIDDHPGNCQAFRQAGGHAVLVPRPWNELAHLEGDLVSVVTDRLAEIEMQRAFPGD